MTRILALAVTGFLVAATLLLPQPRDPAPDPEVSQLASRFAVCLVDEGGGRLTEVAAVATPSELVRFSLFTAGRIAGTMSVAANDQGSTVIPVVDVSAVGTAGGLVEFVEGDSGAASITRSSSSLTAETCSHSTPAQTYMTGGNTSDSNDFEIHLMNPFAGDAMVNLTVTSEVGFESNDRFGSIVVPARSWVVLDLRQIIPGRQSISVLAEAVTGRIAMSARQSLGSDSAVWNALAPAMDWFVPIPSGDNSNLVLVGNPSASEVDYQVDVYGSEGFEETFWVGSLESGQQVSLDLDEVGGEVLAVRVVTTTPVGVTLWSQGDNGLGVTTGAAGSAVRWVLPGALYPSEEPIDPDEDDEDAEPVDPGERARLAVFNPGLEDTDVVVVTLGEHPEERTVAVSAGSGVEVELGPGDGYVVRSLAPVVVLWVGEGLERHALTMGVSFDDG